MWFKHIQAYQFEKPFEHSAESMADCLEKSLFTPCTAYAMSSMGWCSPMGKPEAPLVHVAGHFMMISLKVQEKILPASVIREQLEERCQALEAQDGTRPKGRQKQRLKEEIYNVLLPKAFTKSACLHAVIDKQSQMLWINASSPNKADVFLSALREVLGTLPVIKPEVTSPGSLMTSWLKRGYEPEDLIIEDACVIVDPSVPGGAIRCKRQDLQSKNIQSFLRDGCEIQQMALTWRDQVSFVLGHDFVIKQLRFLDAIQDVVGDIQADTPEQQFDADFVIMTEALQNMMAFMLKLFAADDSPLSASDNAQDSEVTQVNATDEVQAESVPEVVEAS
jgi:recombination associated protein RdgC